MNQMMNAASKILTWHEVCADRSLRDLPYKIESTGDGKLLLTKFTNDRAFLKAQMMIELNKRMAVGKVLGSVPVETGNGTRVTDVSWASRDRWHSQKKQLSATTAPEICVEILTDFNCREYALGKIPLYFESGACEVWLCDKDGRLEFFSAEGPGGPQPTSKLCPGFPNQIADE
jgi:Uma2 family endonuclease